MESGGRATGFELCKNHDGSIEFAEKSSITALSYKISLSVAALVCSYRVLKWKKTYIFQ
jgi:hypothetical protein